MVNLSVGLDHGTSAVGIGRRIRMSETSALATPQPAAGIVDDADRRELLRDVQTNVVGHLTASDGESYRATAPGPRRTSKGNLDSAYVVNPT